TRCSVFKDQTSFVASAHRVSNFYILPSHDHFGKHFFLKVFLPSNFQQLVWPELEYTMNPMSWQEKI
ncbi:hypothetical protein ACE41H_22785, partial [Paenibacillus enshidis]